MQKSLRKPDYILISVTFILVLIGLLMIFSASFKFSYLQRQLLSLVIGLSCLILGFMIDYHWYKRIVMPLSVFTVFLLLLTYLPGLGHTAGGASRWINIAGFIFQPSELAKITLIFFVAMSLENKGKKIKDFRNGVLPLLIIGGGIIGLVLKQPDLGTSLLLVAIVGLMLFVGGAQIWQLLIMGAIGFRAVVWWIAQNPYQKDRVMAFLDPWEHYLGIGFHTVQSLLAVGSGGLFGLGLGYSRQKFSYLPQPFTDFIYAIICEELGFIGGVLVVVLFVIFA
ncbi:MAG: FtsW/RodA/SpoVE family cell cycle protein, partial [Candidatus Margulisiibacteriota bacterium]